MITEEGKEPAKQADDASDVEDYNIADDDEIFSEDEVSNYSSDDAAEPAPERIN